MKKFDNVLIISDIDGTLVDSKWELSRENTLAADYFIKNGGTFTYATGRQVPISRKIISQLYPTAPVICYNGAAIYDYSKEEYLWTHPLDEKILSVVDDIIENCPFVNVEINASDYINVFKGSGPLSPRYEQLVPFFKVVDSVRDVPFPWFKVVLVTPDEYMETLRNYVKSKPYYNDFQFCQSASFLFEILEFGINKGSALPHLLKHLNGINKTIAIGDNENDIELVTAANVGFAVSDASPLLLKHCKLTTVSQKEHVLADIVERLDNKLI